MITTGVTYAIVRRNELPQQGVRNDRLSARTLLAQIATKETVEGVGLGATLDQIKRVLGDAPMVEHRKRRTRIDYGLFEFNLFADSCENIAVQVHRLAGGVDGLIPEVVTEHFRDRVARVSLADLRSEVEKLHGQILEDATRQSGYQVYRVANSHVLIYAVTEEYSDGISLKSGDLWSIMISGAG